MEESELLKKRKEKIEALKAEGIDLYPNDVKIKNTTEEILSRFSDMDQDALTRVEERFSLAGRIMAIRNFGKAAFISFRTAKAACRAIFTGRSWARRLTSFLTNSMWAILSRSRAGFSARKPVN
jgi:lysyl-tRNA synthetase class II